ncbi:ASCH domain-containing protein [Aeromicrobium sp. CTD01-1L150]|uniref:ASCH domain-containing protein n=1 Tax=Aeromicrobium sp. CTD01-1L150 TaxID=3341830 RepID=UPI0035C0FC0B
MQTDPDEIEQFWELARNQARTNPIPGYFPPLSGEALAPPTFAFGGDEEQADHLLALVLDGTKTATASARWDYGAGPEGEGADSGQERTGDEQLPAAGDLAIVLDGRGHPRALIEVTEVRVVPFQEVDAEHARLEGEGDLSLRYWRESHERFFTEFASHDRGFDPAMPVVLERFRLLHPRP